MANQLLKFGGTIPKKERFILGIVGIILIFLVWIIVTFGELISAGILPSPFKVFEALPSLINEYHLFSNIGYTISLNLLGYVMALIAALPLGFIIGIYPLSNALFRNYFEAMRYIPLPTVSGIFISIFGLAFGMKASLLAFGIFIFALPAIVQKILDLQNPHNEKDNVYIQTAKTLGMSNWQMFRYVYWPYITERIYDDIRSLVAISYTYVVIAESLNKDGGIGAMISTFTRQSRMPEIYMLLFIIVLIGILQDQLFKFMDPIIFKHHGKKH